MRDASNRVGRNFGTPGFVEHASRNKSRQGQAGYATDGHDLGGQSTVETGRDSHGRARGNGCYRSCQYFSAGFFFAVTTGKDELVRASPGPTCISSQRDLGNVACLFDVNLTLLTCPPY